MNRALRAVLIAIVGSGVLAVYMFVGNTIFTQEKKKTVEPQPDKTPVANYDHPPKLAFDPKDYYFKFDQLPEAYRAPGEYSHRLEGEKYGFESLSFIITETQPNGGPNLHVHDVEEAHVLMSGTARYQVGDKTFTVEGPYVVKVPAGVPHTFINAGTTPFNLVAVFASKHLESKRLGPNPLIQPTGKK